MESSQFLRAQVDATRRSDGCWILRSPDPLRPYARCIGEHLSHWAEVRPASPFLAQRSCKSWETLTWHDGHRRVREIASALLKLNGFRDQPIAILSQNSINQALLTLACMHIGIPVAPIPLSYAGDNLQRLQTAIDLLRPRYIYADKRAHRSGVLEVPGSRSEWITPETIESWTGIEDETKLDEAFHSIGPDTVAKFLFTSGSTGEPKAVINTQRMLCSNIQARRQCWPFMDDDPPVLLDWLPWSHSFGGNNNLGIVLGSGGTFYIDDGLPLPGLIEKTVCNLQQVCPTVYLNVPRGFQLLLPFLEEDTAFRLLFFSRLRVINYGGAALAQPVWDRLRAMIVESGREILLGSGWGATETGPQATLVHYEPARARVIGLPIPGSEIKMVALDERGRYELRVAGPNVTPGYWNRPDLTAVAFDEEGYYRIGDAGVFADSSEPAQGIEFNGRVAEDFKLGNGRWVRVGELRLRALAALGPIADDIVVTGQDREEIGLLIFPGKSALALGKEELRARIYSAMHDMKQTGNRSASRAIVLEEPPSADAGEITDKGYLNQRAVLDRRATIVEHMYTPLPPSDVIVCE